MHFTILNLNMVMRAVIPKLYLMYKYLRKKIAEKGWSTYVHIVTTPQSVSCTSLACVQMHDDGSLGIWMVSKIMKIINERRNKWYISHNTIKDVYRFT